MDEALAHYVAALGDPEDLTTQDCASVMTAIGQLLHARGEFEQSLQYLEGALELKRRHYGMAHRFIGHTEYLRARAQLALEMHEQARKSLERACAIHLNTLGPHDIWTARSHHALGELLHLLDDHAGAGECYKLALEAYKNSVGASHPATAGLQRDCAVLAYQQGDHQTAERHYVAACDIREQVAGHSDPQLQAWLQELAINRTSMGDADGARVAFEKCIAAKAAQDGTEHLEVAALYVLIGQLEVSRQRYPEALTAYASAHSIRQRLLGPNHPDTATARFHCGVSMWSIGDPWGVLEMGDAVGALERLLGSEHPDAQAARSWLARAAS